MRHHGRRFEAQGRFPFTNVFSGLGILSLLGSITGPVGFEGFGLALVLGSTAFWSRLEGDVPPPNQTLRRRQLEHAALALSLLLLIVDPAIRRDVID
jgi:hypothetical protein